MQTGRIRDRDRIEAFLRRNSAAHVYAIADLDEPFWTDSTWFCAEEAGHIEALALVLGGLALPIVYAVCPAADPPTRALLLAIRDELPDRCFFNLGPDLADELFTGWKTLPEGRYWKMILRDRDACRDVSDEDIEALGPGDLAELRGFLERDAYQPHETGGLFFEPRMLATGCYRAIRERGQLVAVGGVHVHSPRFGVAGLGNVVTRPGARGRGLARRVSAAVLRGLLRDTRHVGLNVHEGNAPARRCYERLGFEMVCPYEEGVAERRERAS